MATNQQIAEFINLIAPVIQKVAKERGYKICSTIIAQACVESAYGTSSLGYKYHNYFGMKCGSSWKGKSVNLKTKEEYKVGVLTTIKDNFRVYDSISEGINGYFDFISTLRYSNLKKATDYKQYAKMLKADGYATSSSYVNTLCSTVEKLGLTKFDGEAKVVVGENKIGYYPQYPGVSYHIDDVMRAIGADEDYDYSQTGYRKRLKIAIANGCMGYTGTATQNTQLINLARLGLLKRV